MIFLKCQSGCLSAENISTAPIIFRIRSILLSTVGEVLMALDYLSGFRSHHSSCLPTCSVCFGHSDFQAAPDTVCKSVTLAQAVPRPEPLMPLYLHLIHFCIFGVLCLNAICLSHEVFHVLLKKYSRTNFPAPIFVTNTIYRTNLCMCVSVPPKCHLPEVRHYVLLTSESPEPSIGLEYWSKCSVSISKWMNGCGCIV